MVIITSYQTMAPDSGEPHSESPTCRRSGSAVGCRSICLNDEVLTEAKGALRMSRLVSIRPVSHWAIASLTWWSKIPHVTRQCCSAIARCNSRGSSPGFFKSQAGSLVGFLCRPPAKEFRQLRESLHLRRLSVPSAYADPPRCGQENCKWPTRSSLCSVPKLRRRTRKDELIPITYS